MTDAVKEHYINYDGKELKEVTHFTDVLQCFCNIEKHEKKRVTGEFTIETASTGKYSAPICDDYFDDKIKGKVYGQSIAFLIIAVNLILKTSIIKLITWVGEDTNSEQLGSITNGVFVAQFFNTGFLLLFVNANLTEHEPHFFTKFFKGPFYDYMPIWYVSVGGKIVQTMMIQSILPYPLLTAGFVVPALK